MVHFGLFFANFWITHPSLWKICRKGDPQRILGPKTHQYGRHIPVPLACYVTPPPRFAALLLHDFTSLQNHVELQNLSKFQNVADFFLDISNFTVWEWVPIAHHDIMIYSITLPLRHSFCKTRLLGFLQIDKEITQAE